MTTTPPVFTATLNATEFAPGAPMEMTITVSPTDGRATTIKTPITAHFNVDGVGSGDVTGTLVRPGPPAPITITDPDRTWTEKSDDGVTYVATATA